MKSTFTYRVNVATPDGKFRGLEFEIPVGFSPQATFYKLDKLLRKKFSFVSAVYLWENKYEVRLVNRVTFDELKTQYSLKVGRKEEENFTFEVKNESN